MLLRCGSCRGNRRARGHGLLSLPIVPVVVQPTCKCVHAVETRRRPHHGASGTCRRVSEDAMSERHYCKKCGGHLMSHHPMIGLTDACGQSSQNRTSRPSQQMTAHLCRAETADAWRPHATAFAHCAAILIIQWRMKELADKELELVGSSESRRRAHGRGALPIAARGPTYGAWRPSPIRPPQKPRERSMRSLLTAATLVLGLAVPAQAQYQAQYTPRDAGRESPARRWLGCK